jgi:hypothetical protein
VHLFLRTWSFQEFYKYRKLISNLCAAGYVRARCVEDYSQLTRRSSDDDALSEGRREATAGPLAPPEATRRKVSPPLSWQKSTAAAGPPIKRVISFNDVIIQEGDEEDGEEENMAEELKKKLGKQWWAYSDRNQCYVCVLESSARPSVIGEQCSAAKGSSGRKAKIRLR